MAVYTHTVLQRSEKFPEPALDEVIAETRQTYSGPLTIGEDLMSFEIGETVTVKRYSGKYYQSAAFDVAVAEVKKSYPGPLSVAVDLHCTSVV